MSNNHFEYIHLEYMLLLDSAVSSEEETDLIIRKRQGAIVNIP